MPVRGIRGATTAPENTREAILEATGELLDALIAANGLKPADVVSLHFTVTPDLDAAFPAAAVRSLGWTDAAVLDAEAPTVRNDVPRCIRVLIHWNTDRPPAEIRHVYMHGATRLRPDRAGSRDPF